MFPVRVRCRRKKFTFAVSSADEFLVTIKVVVLVVIVAYIGVQHNKTVSITGRWRVVYLYYL